MPKSRKKVKSKARREAAKAKKAAAANEQERALDLQFQQLQLNNNSARVAKRSNDMADGKCFHGYDGMSSEEEEIANHFVSALLAAGSGKSIHQIYFTRTTK